MADQPSPYLGVVRAAIVDGEQKPTYPLLKLFQDWDTRLTKGLNLIGQFIGNIAATATVGARPEGIGTTIQNINSTGIVQSAGMVAASSATQGAVVMPVGAVSNVLGSSSIHALTDFDSAGSAAAAQTAAQTFASNASNISSGMLANAVIPAPALGILGGVKAISPVASEWVNSIDNTGNPALSQPAFTDILGTATAGQVPALSALSGAITTGQLPASGQTTIIATAKLTPGGANGSQTFTNGLLTASTPAT